MKTHPSIQSPQSPCHQEALHREDLRPPSVPQRRSAPHKLWFVDGLRQRPRCRRKAGPHYGVSRTGRRARQRIWLESPHPSPPLQTRPVPLPSLRVPELLPALRATSQYPHTLLPKHSPNEDVQGPPQICQSNPFIHNQPFYLMEHGSVCRVRVSAVGLARTDNIYGRRLLLHDPDLNRRCVCPQEPFIIDEECVVQGACRMILWCVQSLKIIVFMLYFRAFCHPIAHPHENIFYLSAYTSHQMQMTGG